MLISTIAAYVNGGNTWQFYSDVTCVFRVYNFFVLSKCLNVWFNYCSYGTVIIISTQETAHQGIREERDKTYFIVLFQNNLSQNNWPHMPDINDFNLIHFSSFCLRDQVILKALITNIKKYVLCSDCYHLSKFLWLMLVLFI